MNLTLDPRVYAKAINFAAESETDNGSVSAMVERLLREELAREVNEDRGSWEPPLPSRKDRT